MQKVMLQATGSTEPREIGIERCHTSDGESYHLHGNGTSREVSVEWQGPDAGWLHSGGRVTAFHALRRGDELHLWMQGRTYRFTVVDRQARRAGAADAPLTIADLTAPMPGTILKINVKEGDTFEAHAPLVIMESMKMEMTLSAPGAGRVKGVHCNVGDLVNMGARLVSLEE